jgi:hypothetical protein
LHRNEMTQRAISRPYRNPVGTQQDSGRQLDANRLGGLEVDGGVELGGLLDGNVRSLLTF